MRAFDNLQYEENKRKESLSDVKISLKKGDRVKTEITDGFWFFGTYSDDFPDSDSILIDSGQMTLIVSKKECMIDK